MNDEQKRLAAQYLPLAKRLANDYKKVIPDYDECLSTLLLILVNAAIAWDEQQIPKFSTYYRYLAKRRIYDYRQLDGLLPKEAGDRPKRVAGSPDIVIEDHSMLEATDRIEKLPPYLRPVARGLVAGYSQREIANDTGVHVSVLNRRVKILRHLWSQQ